MNRHTGERVCICTREHNIKEGLGVEGSSMREAPGLIRSTGGSEREERI